MSAFIVCKNGHYYKNDAISCPYCPKPNAVVPSTNLQLTQIMDLENGASVPSTPLINKDLTKTQVIHPDAMPQEVSLQRKLVGWLVTFDKNPHGVDYKLYEGRNTLGTDSNCSIILKEDAALSGKHVTILFRLGEYKYKDELSTNGTFINGILSDEGNLKDGDKLQIGTSYFLFKAIF